MRQWHVEHMEKIVVKYVKDYPRMLLHGRRGNTNDTVK
jgi:hypothetical protein